jgi:hypothetical protein
VKLTLGPEHVIVQGMRPEEPGCLWGPYQFPRPYNLGDRLVVAVHVGADTIKSFGETNRWLESRDGGVTWKEIPPSVATECGLLLPNSDRIYFPMESGIELTDYTFTHERFLTPGYDFTKQAEEGTLPVPDGLQYQWGIAIRAYNADRLPPTLAKKEWLLRRIPAGKTEPVTEHAKVDWPNLTRVVHDKGDEYKKVLKPIFPRGTPKLGPDGAIWVAVFSGEGHLHPVTGHYSPYYGAAIFRSEDNGRSFQMRGHLEYEAYGRDYPYQSGGYSDSDFEFMPDGSIVWFLRTTWQGATGREWDPMYMARSTDGGHTWSKPEKFADVGILPRLCKLECGVTLLCYARPGTYVTACENDSGTKWTEPLVTMTPDDRSHLANVRITTPSFHEWVGSCNNPELVPLDSHSALLFYSDFYYPDQDSVKRKSVLCRKITVES